MKYKDEIKNRLCKAIDDKSDQLIELTKSILNNPETGFKEFQTSKLVSDQFKALGIPTIENIAITVCQYLCRKKFCFAHVGYPCREL